MIVDAMLIALWKASPPRPIVHVVVTSSGSPWFASVIAVLGLALAVLSLGWQAYSFKQSGGRIDIRVTPAAVSDRGMVQFAEISFLDSWNSEDGTAILLATIYNVGRMPVTIQQCRWAAGSTVLTGSPVARWPATQLPHRLEPHTQCACTIEFATARGMASMAKSVEIRPIVELGNGKVVRGKAFRVIPDAPASSLPSSL
jgi:hypothetical protein